MQLQRYYDLFPSENIKVCLFEDVVKKPKDTLKDIFKFLEVDENVEIDTFKISNVSGTPNGFFGFVLDFSGVGTDRAGAKSLRVANRKLTYKANKIYDIVKTYKNLYKTYIKPA